MFISVKCFTNDLNLAQRNECHIANIFIAIIYLFFICALNAIELSVRDMSGVICRRVQYITEYAKKLITDVSFCHHICLLMSEQLSTLMK